MNDLGVFNEGLVSWIDWMELTSNFANQPLMFCLLVLIIFSILYYRWGGRIMTKPGGGVAYQKNPPQYGPLTPQLAASPRPSHLPVQGLASLVFMCTAEENYIDVSVDNVQVSSSMQVSNVFMYYISSRKWKHTQQQQR